MAPELKEFKWGGSWYLNLVSGKNYPFPEDIKFHKLLVFTMSLIPLDFARHHGCCGDNPAHACYSLTWLTPFMKAVCGVTTIRLASNHHMVIFFLSILTQPETMKLFSNLNHITLHTVILAEIKLLLKLDKPLKKLEIIKLEFMESQDFRYFNYFPKIVKLWKVWSSRFPRETVLQIT